MSDRVDLAAVRLAQELDICAERSSDLLAAMKLGGYPTESYRELLWRSWLKLSIPDSDVKMTLLRAQLGLEDDDEAEESSPS